MRRWRTWAAGGLILSVGYFCGWAQAWQMRTAAAQSRTAQDVSDETASKIREANRKLQEAMEALKAEGRYEALTEGVNAYLILSGGGNAREDLESGRGVDPDTFASIYAGRVSPEVQELLDRDDQGRVTYNNEVVRMYSPARLQRAAAQRLKIVEGSL